jgi:hypothetical protein
MDLPVKIELIVTPSLYEHFNINLQQQHSTIPANVVISSIVKEILDTSEYPLSAKQTSDGKIILSYHLHSFSQPFFE